MKLIRFSAAPEGDNGDEFDAIRLYDESGGPLTDGARGRRHLTDLKTETFGHLIAPGEDLQRAMARDLGDFRPGRVIVLTHGFEYDPLEGLAPEPGAQPNPHNAIFHDRPDLPPHEEHLYHTTPWLSRLELREDDLVIAYAFASDPAGLSLMPPGGGLRGEWRRSSRRFFSRAGIGGVRQNIFAHAYEMAGNYALGLAGVLAALADSLAARPGGGAAPVSLIAHSLGTRVVTAALRLLSLRHAETAAIEGIDRVLFLASALSPLQVEGMARDLRAVPGRDAAAIEFFNFTSSRDFVLKRIAAPLAMDIGRRIEARLGDPDLEVASGGPTPRPPHPGWLIFNNLLRSTPVVGVHGPGAAAEGLSWIDIPLDHPETRVWGAGLGFDLAGDIAECWQDHWVHDTHAPNWALYRRILEDPAEWSVEAIRNGTPGARAPLSARPRERYRPVTVSAAAQAAGPRASGGSDPAPGAGGAVEPAAGGGG